MHLAKCEFYSEILFKLKLNLWMDLVLWCVDLLYLYSIKYWCPEFKISFLAVVLFVSIFQSEKNALVWPKAVIDSLLDVQVWNGTRIKTVQVYSEKKMMHVNLCFVHSRSYKMRAKTWWNTIKRLLKSNLNQINPLLFLEKCQKMPNKSFSISSTP